MINAYSIVIPTFNRSAMLDEIITSLALQSDGLAGVEVLVCDSDSGDGTAEIMASWMEKHPGSVKHLQTINNLSAKRNYGLRNATYDHVIFLDDDCVPRPGFLETYGALTQSLVANDKKLILCGETRFPERWTEASNYYRFRDSRHFDHEQAVAGIPLNFKTIVAMNMCVNKEAFVMAVGGFNEAFVGYGSEDQEMGWRLEEAGFSMRACEACATHNEMSRDVAAFGDKIRRTARDGMVQLLEVAPEAAKSIKLARMLDPDYPDRRQKDRFVTAAFRLILKLRLHDLLAWALIRTDRVRALYCPIAYRAYMACCYVSGAAQRDRRLSAEQAATGWAGSSR